MPGYEGHVTNIEETRALQQYATNVLESIADAFFVLDRQWRFTYVNPAAEIIFRRPTRELLYQNIWKVFPSAVDTTFYRRCREAMRTKESFRFETYYAPARMTLLVHLYPFKDGLTVHMSDHTDRWLAFEAVRRSEELYRFITENSADLITLATAQGDYLYVSSVAESMLGFDPQDLIGKRVHELVHPDDRVAGTAIFSGTPHDPTDTQITTYRLRRKDDTYIWVETTSRIYSFDEAGSVKEIISVSRDITERKESEDAVVHLAFHDPLTSLPNRTLLTDRLHVALEHARRQNEHLAVLFLDLDRFKVINDTLGHQAGDEVLKETARRLKACVRSEDTVARFAGDEFVIMLTGINGLEDAITVAKAIIQSFNPTYPIGRQEVHVKTSIGIALYPNDGNDAETLLQNADNALYQAKDAGRNNYKAYTPTMHLKSAAKMFLENGLRKTIERNELRILFQPIWDLRANNIHSAEALIRWNHPAKGIVLPGEFIPLAEETGIITSIGEWLLQALANQIHSWREQKQKIPIISVNISPRQFNDEGFLHFLSSTIRSLKIPTELIQLEVTERVAMENVNESIPKMRSLKDQGFRIALDDFGIGYSSLSYLRQLPLDVLKVDQSFTRECTLEDREQTIVQAIVNLGHTLNLTVCTEGIETEEQYQFFQTIGCDLVQGYYIAKPLPNKEFTEVINPKKKLVLPGLTTSQA